MFNIKLLLKRNYELSNEKTEMRLFKIIVKYFRCTKGVCLTAFFKVFQFSLK